MNDIQMLNHAHTTITDTCSGDNQRQVDKARLDVDHATRTMTPKEYCAFIDEIRKNLPILLPPMEVVGVLARLAVDAVDSMGESMRRAMQLGKVHATFDDKGELTSLGDDCGNMFYRNWDGKWYQRSKDGRETAVSNVRVDEEGKINYHLLFHK